MPTVTQSIIIFALTLCLLPNALTKKHKPYKEGIIPQWNEALIKATVKAGYTPLMISHTMALVHTSMYNAWVPYDTKASTAHDVKGIPRQPRSNVTDANKHAAVCYAAYYSLRELLPGQKSIFKEIMERHGYSMRDLDGDINTPAGIGVKAAKRVLRARWNVRSNHKKSNVIEVPGYGLITPFALNSSSQFRPKGKSKTIYTNSDGFLNQAQQIYDNSKSLTKRQRVAASFWLESDSSDPCAWCSITREICRRDKSALDDDVKMFFVVANTFLDATIVAYDIQNQYNPMRPVTMIKQFIDPHWEGIVANPDSTESFATLALANWAVGAMLRFTTDTSHYGGKYIDSETGIELIWETYKEAWEEAKLSKVYGGIYFENVIEAEQKIGTKVAELVWNKAKDLMKVKGRSKY